MEPPRSGGQYGAGQAGQGGVEGSQPVGGGRSRPQRRLPAQQPVLECSFVLVQERDGDRRAVFTGIGAVGAITLGVVLNDDPVGAGRIAALTLIVSGIVLAKLA
ncbi:hypothetical protein SAMN04489712_11856 [Thermomonospora echinospora]|uniref:Uncharacterized protein n=1 Tax=Thermomonospora echinospora TaxID=1992 RepID=A0A1H6DJS7_9ACTN|nr:hypothetical protein [Thermomonospora echinospora]SEG85667.1 hypothetical protein SAMN04489712_11856 [Thermomonospora echinospora]